MVSKLTGLPSGSGVFKSEDWIHCGSVSDGKFISGRKVSVNREMKSLRLALTKYLPSGSKLEKIENFTPSGVDRGFYIDGKR